MQKLYYLFLLIIFFSCANEKAITGGPQDKNPPEVMNMYPENNSVNFNSNQIIIEFDERINVENFKENLIISPKTDIKIKPKVKKKTLTLNIDGAFETNKTYTFFMRNSIIDLTEKNKIENLKYVISTGNYIDSLTLEGTSIINKNNTTQQGAKIFLYNATDSSDIRKHIPLYFTITNAEGEYKFENLPKGEYKIYYVNDINNNLLFDNEDEDIGFLVDPIKLDSSIIVESMLIFKNDTIIKAPITKSYCNHFSINYNEKINAFYVTDTNEIKIEFTKYISNDKQKIIIYNDKIQDSTKIVLNYHDFNGNYGKKEEYFYKIINDTLCKQNIDIQILNKVTNPKDSIIIDIKELIDSLKTKSVHIWADSVKIETLDKIKHKLVNNQLTIYIDTKATQNITINFDSNSIKSLQENMKFYSKEFIVPITDETQYGIISGKLNYNKDNFIIELLDNNYNTIISTQTKEFSFTKLTPQEYTIRIKIDNNNDGIFQEGNYERKEIPEKIVFHKDKINLRPNWEIKDISISISE